MHSTSKMAHHHNDYHPYDLPNLPTFSLLPAPLRETYDLFMHPLTPLVFGAVYAVVSTVWSRANIQAQKKKNVTVNGKRISEKPKEEKLKFDLTLVLVLAHNLALCIFSAWTFWETKTMLWQNVVVPVVRGGDAGFHGFCDTSAHLHTLISPFVYMFYLSKYYEIIDTVILLVKGKPSSVLQTYHHTGAIITMWALMKSRSTAAWIFVVLNSFIHTIMYFYYFLTSLHIRPKWKPLLTSLQILQFLLGMTLGLTYILKRDCTGPMTPTEGNEMWVPKVFMGLGLRDDQASTLLTVLYTTALVKLFVEFARRTYGGKKGGKGKSE